MNGTTGDAAIISAEGLGLAFGSVRALEDVNFTVKQGEVFAVIGPNGAGKSSLFNVLTSVYQPTSGAVSVLGADMSRTRPDKIASLGIVRSFQNLGLFPEMSVLENVLIGGHHRTTSGIFRSLARSPQCRREEGVERDRALATLANLAISDLADRPVGQLPYGVQKRVELARCLNADPKVLLLDEPVAGMSSEDRVEITTLIEDLRANPDLTLLIVEHDVGMVMRVADTVMVLDFGGVVACGAPEQIRTDPAVISAYLGSPKEDVA